MVLRWKASRSEGVGWLTFRAGRTRRNGKRPRDVSRCAPLVFCGARVEAFFSIPFPRRGGLGGARGGRGKETKVPWVLPPRRMPDAV